MTDLAQQYQAHGGFRCAQNTSATSCASAPGCFMDASGTCVAWGAPCVEPPGGHDTGSCDAAAPPAGAVPVPCLEEQCLHHYCHPRYNPDLQRQFPAELSGKLNNRTIQGWAGCAARYCLDQSGWCSTDADCAGSMCVQECGESGLGCFPLWHDAETHPTCTTGTEGAYKVAEADAGKRSISVCHRRQWTLLQPQFTGAPRQRDFPSTDVDACLQSQCIHNKGQALPWVAAYDGTTP
jgi:hypothetical protein